MLLIWLLFLMNIQKQPKVFSLSLYMENGHMSVLRWRRTHASHRTEAVSTWKAEPSEVIKRAQALAEVDQSKRKKCCRRQRIGWGGTVTVQRGWVCDGRTREEKERR